MFLIDPPNEKHKLLFMSRAVRVCVFDVDGVLTPFSLQCENATVHVPLRERVRGSKVMRRCGGMMWPVSGYGWRDEGESVAGGQHGARR